MSLGTADTGFCICVSFVQLFEFLSTIVSSRRLAKVWLKPFQFSLLVVCCFGFLPKISSFQVIASNVRELVYQTVAFLQVTEQQVRINHASSAYTNMIGYSGYISPFKSPMINPPELAQIQGVV